MANIIESIGYSLGKLHVGLIAYLCDLFREGNPEPLGSLLTELHVPLPQNPIPAREWNSVDLAILDASTWTPHLLIEMKVDDHEHYTRRKREKLHGHQTVVYAQAFPDCKAYLYVTLGMGEFFAPPQGERFCWIRTRRFLKALEAIRTPDHLIENWRESVQREVDRQDRVAQLDRSDLSKYRAGSWNVYLLGFLKEALLERLGQTAPTLLEMLSETCTCYTYGTRPDTILNFGWAKCPAYMEITYNGRLHLKMNLEGFKTLPDKQRGVAAAIETVVQRYPEGTYKLHEGGKIGKSKTVASFEVGLAQRDGYLEFESSQDDACAKIASILQIVHDGRPWPSAV